MATAIPDLWPEVIEPDQVLAPSLILRQQANNLGERTHNIVVGEVESRALARNRSAVLKYFPDAEIEHTFFISAPLVGVRVPIIVLQHGLSAYPSVVETSRIKSNPTQIDSSDALIDFLRKILSDETTLHVVRSLLAVSQDSAPMELADAK